MRKALTDRGIKALKPRAQAYIVFDAVVPGSGVRVMPSGFKSFVFVARYPGAKHPAPKSLGSYGELTLEQARGKARTWIELLGQGRNPAVEEARIREESERRRSNMFAAVLDDYVRLVAVGPDPANPRQRKGNDVARDLRRTFVPLWGEHPITSITRQDVLAAIEAVRDRPAPVQARNLLGYLKTFFSWAIERGVYGLEASPCDHLRAIRIIGHKRAGDRILSDDELFAFWRATGRLGYPMGSAYRLLALSGVRLNEAADASWREFDLAGKFWTIPSNRMKGKNGAARPHVVPLTPAMLDLLDTLPRFEHGEYLFSTTLGSRPAWMSDKIKKALDRRMLRTLRALARTRDDDPTRVQLEKWVNHDLRRTLRSRLSMLRIHPEVAEAILAHAKAGIKGVYDRYDLLDERRTALELWSTHLNVITEPSGQTNVVRLRPSS